jgi:hypothetical protein
MLGSRVADALAKRDMLGKARVEGDPASLLWESVSAAVESPVVLREPSALSPA